MSVPPRGGIGVRGIHNFTYPDRALKTYMKTLRVVNFNLTHQRQQANQQQQQQKNSFFILNYLKLTTTLLFMAVILQPYS